MATTTSNVNVQSKVRVLATGAPDQGTLTWSAGSDGTFDLPFTNGSGAGAVNKVLQDDAAVTTNFDFDAGTLLDPLGAALTITRVAFFRIIAGDANAANLECGGDWLLTKLLTGWVDDAITVPVRPGGHIEFSAPNATGIAVTATTGDVLTITVTGTDTFRILLLGS